MGKPIEKIVVVGGGTAGWMSAAFLNRVLGGATNRKIDIKVVESDDVGIIGVGEASFPTIRRMMQVIGISESRLLAYTDGAFKNAIKFVDWATIPKPGEHNHFYHQFDAPVAVDGFDAMTHWKALRDSGADVPAMDEAVSIQAALCDNHRSPKYLNSPPYEGPLPYAYHFDTIKLGRLLREVAIERGVERIVDHVTAVRRAENGDIAAIDTRDGRTLEADLYIDCTGFAAVLIEKNLGEPFIDYTDRLLCDRAVAGQIPHRPGVPARPYTVANAKTAGWIWEIDLVHRTGIGYVYSSQYIDDDAAERELIEHAAPEIRGELEPRRLKMRIGRRNQFWVNNCVAIGLAGGFIEPIKSTGIHLCELGLTQLVENLNDGVNSAPMRKQYNTLMRDVYDEIVAFIQIHYIFNQRVGLPFWDHYRTSIVKSDILQNQLELWAGRMPTRTDLKSRINVFDGYSYCAMMAGVGALPKANNISPFINLKTSAEVMSQIAQARVNAVKALPTQVEFLAHMRSLEG